MNPVCDSKVLIKEHPYRRWISYFVNCIYIYFCNYTFNLGKHLNVHNIYSFLKGLIMLFITYIINYRQCHYNY